MRSVFNRLCVVAALATGLSACNTGKTFSRLENIRPPAPGAPSTINEVTGIYRNVVQGTLQLRRNGDLNLVTTDGGADAGIFTLGAGGRFEVHTDSCKGAVGSYALTVTGPQRAGSAALHFAVQADSCAARARALTGHPWVYANS